MCMSFARCEHGCDTASGQSAKHTSACAQAVAAFHGALHGELGTAVLQQGTFSYMVVLDDTPQRAARRPSHGPSRSRALSLGLLSPQYVRA